MEDDPIAIREKYVDDVLLEQQERRKLSNILKDICDNLKLEGYTEKEDELEYTAYKMLEVNINISIDNVRQKLDDKRNGI